MAANDGTVYVNHYMGEDEKDTTGDCSQLPIIYVGWAFFCPYDGQIHFIWFPVQMMVMSTVDPTDGFDPSNAEDVG